MNTNKLREIDRLVSEMHDDGLEDSDLRQLEELLTDDPAAQQRYWQLVNSHVALSVAVSSNSLHADSSRKRSAALMPAEASCMNRRIAQNLLAHYWWLTVAAAVLLIGLVGTSQWTSSGDSLDATTPSIASQSPFSAIDKMPTITQVSWEGPSFAEDSQDWQPTSVASAGAITLRVNEGEVADGYLFCLMPGESVKLMATFDATGENSLSVVEIAGGERATVKKVSFHNAGAGPKPLHANPHVRNRRYGVLGHWSETNASAIPRYFLLTGVHKLAKPSENESWRLSKIAVLVESHQAVHLGWDDSGPAPLEGDIYHEDYDYDDLAASLLFDRQSSNDSIPQDAIQVIASQEFPAPMVPSTIEGGYDFLLAPHSAAIVKVASEARELNAIVAIDRDTQEMLWATSKPTPQASNLGAACLLNPTATAKQVRLLGVHKPSDSKGPGIPWRASTSEKLYEQPGFLIVGFDDSFGDKDFNDLRVSVLITKTLEPYGP